MAVALHGDKLAHPASARMIALAVENKVDVLTCTLLKRSCQLVVLV